MCRSTGKLKSAAVWMAVIVAALALPISIFAGGEAEQNVKTVQQVYEFFGKGDVEGVIGLLSEDFVQIMPGDPNTVPWAGTFKGHDGFIKFVTTLGGNAEFLQTDHKEYIAQRDKVVVPFFEQIRAKPTGRVCQFDAVAVWTVREGKIARLEIYEDTVLIAEAFR